MPMLALYCGYWDHLILVQPSPAGLLLVRVRVRATVRVFRIGVITNLTRSEDLRYFRPHVGTPSDRINSFYSAINRPRTSHRLVPFALCSTFQPYGVQVSHTSLVQYPGFPVVTWCPGMQRGSHRWFHNNPCIA